jgi:hypothetical protein
LNKNAYIWKYNLELILIFLTLISPPMQILAYTISTSLTLQSVLPSDRIETNIEVLIESPIFLSSVSAIYFYKFLATVSIKVSLPNVKAICLIQFRRPAKHKAWTDLNKIVSLLMIVHIQTFNCFLCFR